MLLEKLRQDHSRWRGQSRNSAYRLAERKEAVTEPEWEKHWETVAQGRSVQATLLTEAAGLRLAGTVEPVLKDCPIGHRNMVFQDRQSLVTGSVTLKYGTFCQEYVVLQDRCSLMGVASQDRFHCIGCVCGQGRGAALCVLNTHMPGADAGGGLGGTCPP